LVLYQIHQCLKVDDFYFDSPPPRFAKNLTSLSLLVCLVPSFLTSLCAAVWTDIVRRDEALYGLIYVSSAWQAKEDARVGRIHALEPERSERQSAAPTLTCEDPIEESPQGISRLRSPIRRAKSLRSQRERSS